MLMRDEYKIEQRRVYKKEWPSKQWQWIGTFPTTAEAELYVDRLVKVEAILESTSRDAWVQLLQKLFPDMPFCNCRYAFYGCRYGCQNAQLAARDAVADKVLDLLRSKDNAQSSSA